MRQPLLSVRLNNPAAAWCGGSSWAGHDPTAAAAYRMHKYNRSITTARALSITLDLGWHPSVHLHGLLTKATCSLSVRVMLKNADTGHYTAAVKGRF